MKTMVKSRAKHIYQYITVCQYSVQLNIHEVIQSNIRPLHTMVVPVGIECNFRKKLTSRLQNCVN